MSDSLTQRGGWTAGVDEAGRGPLAGPVVAAAVILDPERPIQGLADSKALTPSAREAFGLVHRDLRRGGAALAAEAVLELVDASRSR